MPKFILLDPGHGQETPGKRSPVWPDGSILYEYEFNRDICSRIMSALFLDGLGTKVYNLVPELNDISLAERVRRARRWCTSLGNDALLISVHANAGGGTGFEVFTTPGEDHSDLYASQFSEMLKASFPDIKFRADAGDGDPDKEANFYIIKNAPCPAMLVENLFMDNEADCRKLLDPGFRDKLAGVYVEFIKKILS